ncbi:hypothetical protein SeKA_B0012 (plasmid) [Salmonella enterica subsp. enterica serovar Kentucky str. CVM29188]|nr:hypothetical protein SeKA_B0012 [Salmonella enterica subsp. enterica serovar Kentucky str. CVM29188]
MSIYYKTLTIPPSSIFYFPCRDCNITHDINQENIKND